MLDSGYWMLAGSIQTILDFGLRIADSWYRCAVSFLIEPPQADLKSKIPDLKSQIRYKNNRTLLSKGLLK